MNSTKLSILFFASCCAIFNVYFYKDVCVSSNAAAMAFTTADKAPLQNDSLTWIDDLKLFRTAVYNNDLATIKKYFKFPVLNSANEIWMLVLTEKESEKRNIYGGKIIPFKEEDLVKYYKKLFSPSFVKCLMKVKTEELYKKNNVETQEQKEGADSRYKMYVTYDKKTKLLTFNMAYNTVIKDEKGQIEDGGESNVIYNFIVQKSGHIIFKEVRLAG